tara:strand:+ start:4788 stop:5336 length:549 start_codon:yes stop_codon:yes gene_type:complete
VSTVWFGIGSNRDRERFVRAGISALHDAFATSDQPMYVSRVFESDAVGFSGNRFFNLVASVTTDLGVESVSAICKDIERQHGHADGATRFSPRTLDIDILLYDDLISESPVQLPRAEILTNAFVLWPLAEISPNNRHPQTGKSFAEHWQNYRGEQVLEPLSFEFDALPHLKLIQPSTRKSLS